MIGDVLLAANWGQSRDYVLAIAPFSYQFRHAGRNLPKRFDILV